MPALNSSKEMKIITIDSETTMSDDNPKRSDSNPYGGNNRVVAFGAKTKGGVCTCTYHEPGNVIEFEVGTGNVDAYVLVGHNIKFDLSYLRSRFKEPSGYDDWIGKARIWDTQIGEYVLSGQREKFASLQATGERRMLGGKDAIEFTAPEGAARYTEEELIPYLKRDLELTEEIALEQMAEATNEQFDLIIQMGDALKTIVDMEGNGMFVDEDELITKLAQVGIAQNEVECRLTDWSCNPELTAAKPEWYNSAHVLSCMIYGGHLHYDIKEPNGMWKSGAKKGQVRYKTEHRIQYYSGMVNPTALGLKAGKKKTKSADNLYSVDEDTLHLIQKTCILGYGDMAVLNDVIKLRSLKKVAGTYYENLIDMQIDGVVHHTLNQCATATGRLSSSSPNLQNVPMANEDEVLNVKGVFTSRYGEEGLLLEIDFKQIEVCALAWLTKDRQLNKDIVDGLDIHTTLAKQIGWDTKDKRVRRDVKSIVFAMIYGAGAKGISESSGIELSKVKAVIAAFYGRYVDIKPYYDDISTVIEKNVRYDILVRDDKGNPNPMFEWTSPTGRTYMYTQDPYRPGPAYTQVRNYPVQGTATGDIVPVVLGEIGNVLRNLPMEAKEKVKIVNTTHDSVTFDCATRDDMNELIWKLNEDVFSRVNDVINTRLPTIKWDIPLVVEYEAGPNWGELETLDIRHL